MRQTTAIAAALLGLLPGALLACASRGIDVREYVLTASAPADAGVAAGPELVIGVGPVVVPAYLRRSEIVARVAENEIRASDTHRWGEDLDQGLARVVAEDLEGLLPAAQVHAFPWRERVQADYRVAITVERLERVPDGSVSLQARWALLGGPAGTRITEHTARIREEEGGVDHAATVAAMSRAVARLSQDIARAIRDQTGPVTVP